MNYPASSDDWRAGILVQIVPHINTVLAEVRAAVERDELLPWRQTFDNPFFSVYVRVTQRSLLMPYKRKPITAKTVDLATIAVVPAYQQLGIFKMLLSELQSIAHAGGRAIYIENVVNPKLDLYLRRQHYAPLRFTGGISGLCYARLPST